MGMLDHRLTRRFEVAAPAKLCNDAFIEAMTCSKGALSLRKVRSASDPAANSPLVARYEGRAGIGSATATLSKEATLTGEAAKGSEIIYRIHSNEKRLLGPPRQCTHSGRAAMAPGSLPSSPTR